MYPKVINQIARQDSGAGSSFHTACWKFVGTELFDCESGNMPGSRKGQTE